MSTTPENPFVIARLPDRADATAFADRETEVARIAEAFREPGGKLIVYGERRLGKSAALQVAAARVRTRRLPVAIVNFSTASSPIEAATQLLTAVHRAAGRSWTELIRGIASRLALQITATPTPEAGGLPTVSVTLSGPPSSARQAGDRPELVPEVLAAVEAELRRSNRRLGLALDEFQRLHEWGGEAAEWALKGVTETHRAISYVLAGSARTLIEEMVGSKTRALWKLFDVMRVGPIDPGLFAGWIRDRSEDTGVAMTMPAAQMIVQVAGPRTRDILQLARAAWTAARGTRPLQITEERVGEAMEALVRDQDSGHCRVWTHCDARSQDLLRILAADPTVPLTAADTLDRYRLGPKSSVQYALNKMVATELLTTAAGRYAYDDPFFRRWVQVTALADTGTPTPPLLPSPPPDPG